MSEELKVDPKDTREEVYEVPINPPKDPPGGFPPLKDFTPGKKYVIFKEVTNNGLPREIGVLYRKRAKNLHISQKCLTCERYERA